MVRCRTTRRAWPRVPPKGKTYRKATEEAQIVGTDVLGCPKRQDIKHNGTNAEQTRRAGPRVPPKGKAYRKATEEAQIHNPNLWTLFQKMLHLTALIFFRNMY